MVKYMEWGGESSGFCQAFPNTMSGSENLSPLMSAESSSPIARDCIKTTRDSEVQTPLRGVALNEIYVTDLGSIETVMDSMTTNSLKTASVHMVTSTDCSMYPCSDARRIYHAKRIGQMNQFVESAKEESGQKK